VIAEAGRPDHGHGTAAEAAGQASAWLGLWSAALIAVAFLVFAVCFVGLAGTGVFRWTDLAGYVSYVRGHDQALADIARLAMLLFGPLYIVLLNAIHDHTPPARTVWVRIALCFGVAFAVLTGAHYFVQLTAVRLGLQRGDLAGLEQVVQANPVSAMSAVNMLGWTVFLGLSSLFVVPALAAGRHDAGGPAVLAGGDAGNATRERAARLDRAIAVAFGLNAVCCLVGGIAYILDNVVVVFLTIDLGMGAAVLAFSILLAIRFRAIVRAAAR
jgi:hypothetical protein